MQLSISVQTKYDKVNVMVINQRNEQLLILVQHNGVKAYVGRGGKVAAILSYDETCQWVTRFKLCRGRWDVQLQTVQTVRGLTDIGDGLHVGGGGGGCIRSPLSGQS